MTGETVEFFNGIKPHYPELSGKVALVTGSGKGIGKGIAYRLGREGMKVVLTARTLQDIEEVAQELREVGVEALPIVGDIGREEDITHLFEVIVREWGSVDLLVNNAANLHRVFFADVTPQMFTDEMASNVTGPFIASHKAAEIMKKKGGGSIIHISSVGGLRAHYPGLPYDATKGALDAMTRVMGIELIQYGVRVNGIAPGAIYTEKRSPPDDPRMQAYLQRIPSNRMGTPLEIGAAVAFLASDDAAYIVGQTLYVDGGITAQLSPPQYPI